MEFLSKKLFSKKYKETDEDWLEVKLSRDEYFALKTQIKDLTKTKSSLQTKNSDLESECKKKDEEILNLKKEKSTLSNKYDILFSNYNKILKENTNFVIQNSKLKSQKEKVIQISKERANVIRGLVPKKKNTGFRLLNQKEVGVHKTLKRTKLVRISLSEKEVTSFEDVYIKYYKYSIELPIFSDFEFKEAKNIFSNDLKNIFGLSITTSKIETVNNTDDYIFNLEFSRSEKSNFYRADFITTKFLDLEKLNYNKD